MTDKALAIRGCFDIVRVPPPHDHSFTPPLPHMYRGGVVTGALVPMDTRHKHHANHQVTHELFL